MASLFGTKVSKFRNVIGTDPKAPECWTELRLSPITTESTYIKCNGTYFAVALQVRGFMGTSISLLPLF